MSSLGDAMDTFGDENIPQPLHRPIDFAVPLRAHFNTEWSSTAASQPNVWLLLRRIWMWLLQCPKEYNAQKMPGRNGFANRNTYNGCINYTARRKTLRQPNSITAQCRDNGKWWGKATKFTFHDRDTEAGPQPGEATNEKRKSVFDWNWIKFYADCDFGWQCCCWLCWHSMAWRFDLAFFCFWQSSELATILLNYARQGFPIFGLGIRWISVCPFADTCIMAGRENVEHLTSKSRTNRGEQAGVARAGESESTREKEMEAVAVWALVTRTLPIGLLDWIYACLWQWKPMHSIRRLAFGLNEFAITDVWAL